MCEIDLGPRPNPQNRQKPCIFHQFLHKMLTVSSEIAIFGILRNLRSYRGATPETGVPRLAIRTLPQKSV